MKTPKFSKRDKPSEIKCRLCGKIVSVTRWRKHLIKCHNVGDNPRRRDFFIGCKQDLEKAQREWYNPDKKVANPRILIGHCETQHALTISINRLSYSECLKGIKGEIFEEQFYCDRCGKRTNMGWRYFTIDGYIRLCQNCMTIIKFNQKATIIYTPMGNKR